MHMQPPRFLPTVEMTDQSLFEYSGSKDLHGDATGWNTVSDTESTLKRTEPARETRDANLF